MFFSINSYLVRAEAVRGDAISFEKTVTETENVFIDKLQPDTEYKISVEGISKLPPKSEVSFSHRRTKRRYGSYRPQRPQTPATDSRRTSSSNVSIHFLLVDLITLQIFTKIRKIILKITENFCLSEKFFEKFKN